MIKKISIRTDKIRLDQFLKWADAAGSGGEAKYLIQEGFVWVNKVIEKRRGICLVKGDLVELKEPDQSIIRLEIT